MTDDKPLCIVCGKPCEQDERCYGPTFIRVPWKIWELWSRSEDFARGCYSIGICGSLTGKDHCTVHVDCSPVQERREWGGWEISPRGGGILYALRGEHDRRKEVR